METGLENLNSLLEELGLKSRGMYLPSSITGGNHELLFLCAVILNSLK